jgi:hypothetical protein
MIKDIALSLFPKVPNNSNRDFREAKNMRATFQDIVLTKYTINVKGPVATNINICKLQYKHIWYPCIYNLCFMLFHWEVLSFSSPKWTLQLLKLMKGCHRKW